MNLEGITLRVLAHELTQALTGGKIIKIFMPSRASLLLQVALADHTANFWIDLGGESPLITLPERLPQRPDIPPSFCMLLRKHLEEGRIAQIHQIGLDRVLVVDVDLIGAERKILTKHLVLELTGKNSNIVFLDENGSILDALRHIGKTQNRVRQILPGLSYCPPPPQDGLDFLTASPHAIREKAVAQGDVSLVQGLIASTVGIGKLTAQEVAYRSGYTGSVQLMQLPDAQKIEAALASLQTEIQDRLTQSNLPVFAQIDARNRMKNLVPYHPQSHSEWKLQEFSTLLDAEAYSVSLIPVQIPDKELLQKLVHNQAAKTEKRMTFLAQDLANAEKAETQKVMADTLMSYGYQVKKGSTSCELPNIYNPKERLTIPLSPERSVMENAQAYYKKYNKSKRAVEEIKEQQKEADALLAYLRSLDVSLDTASTKGDIAEIKQEVIALGLLPQPKKKQPSQSKSEPLKIMLSPETTLYIGKNNKQNDYVTFKLGRSNDLWFHAKNIPGSHVILKTTLPEPRQEDILLAAQLAAGFSKGKDSDRVPVDYTPRRLVKKPSGAKPGFVIFTGQTTVYVKPRTSVPHS